LFAADPVSTLGIVDFSSEADSCLRPLGYELAPTTVVYGNVAEGTIGFGASADFQGGRWNLVGSIAPIERGAVSLTPMQALDRCAAALVAPSAGTLPGR
jgi:hypothetical protein